MPVENFARLIKDSNSIDPSTSSIQTDKTTSQIAMKISLENKRFDEFRTMLDNLMKEINDIQIRSLKDPKLKPLLNSKQNEFHALIDKENESFERLLVLLEEYIIEEEIILFKNIQRPKKVIEDFINVLKAHQTKSVPQELKKHIDELKDNIKRDYELLQKEIETELDYVKSKVKKANKRKEILNLKESVDSFVSRSTRQSQTIDMFIERIKNAIETTIKNINNEFSSSNPAIEHLVKYLTEFKNYFSEYVKYIFERTKVTYLSIEYALQLDSRYVNIIESQEQRLEEYFKKNPINSEVAKRIIAEEKLELINGAKVMDNLYIASKRLLSHLRFSRGVVISTIALLSVVGPIAASPAFGGGTRIKLDLQRGQLDVKHKDKGELPSQVKLDWEGSKEEQRRLEKEKKEAFREEMKRKEMEAKAQKELQRQKEKEEEALQRMMKEIRKQQEKDAREVERTRVKLSIQRTQEEREVTTNQTNSNKPGAVIQTGPNKTGAVSTSSSQSTTQ